MAQPGGQLAIKLVKKIPSNLGFPSIFSSHKIPVSFGFFANHHLFPEQISPLIFIDPSLKYIVFMSDIPIPNPSLFCPAIVNSLFNEFELSIIPFKAFVISLEASQLNDLNYLVHYLFWQFQSYPSGITPADLTSAFTSLKKFYIFGIDSGITSKGSRPALAQTV